MKKNFFHVILSTLIKCLLICTFGILVGICVFSSSAIVNFFFILGCVTNGLILITLIVSHFVYKEIEKIDNIINNGGN